MNKIKFKILINVQEKVFLKINHRQRCGDLEVFMAWGIYYLEKMKQ